VWERLELERTDPGIVIEFPPHGASTQERVSTIGSTAIHAMTFPDRPWLAATADHDGIHRPVIDRPLLARAA
jgi:hypothetical protein